MHELPLLINIAVALVLAFVGGVGSGSTMGDMIESADGYCYSTMSALREPESGSQRISRRRTATLSVPRLRSAQPRTSTHECLQRRSARNDLARLWRTQQFAWTLAHLRGVAQHRHLVDKKKVNDLPELSATLLAVADPVLELDELWSFVLKKARKRWIWIAL